MPFPWPLPRPSPPDPLAVVTPLLAAAAPEAVVMPAPLEVGFTDVAAALEPAPPPAAVTMPLPWDCDLGPCVPADAPSAVTMPFDAVLGAAPLAVVSPLEDCDELVEPLAVVIPFEACP